MEHVCHNRQQHYDPSVQKSFFWGSASGAAGVAAAAAIRDEFQRALVSVLTPQSK